MSGKRETKPLRKKPLHGSGSSFSQPINSSLSAALPKSRTAAALLRAIIGSATGAVTPCSGKPVEINALWINALETMAEFARLLANPPDAYERHAAKAKNSFQKFWNAGRSCCFDVIDSPDVGTDASLRPNQIFAVSLPISPLTQEQRGTVVDVCARHLLTSYGLRSLAPNEPGYNGHYVGSPRDRDAAYHQGTVWGWLLGP